MGSITGLIKGDIRSLDYSACGLMVSFTFHR